MGIQDFYYKHLPLYYHEHLKIYYDMANSIINGGIFNKVQIQSLLKDTHDKRQTVLKILLKRRILQEKF